jgi:Uma2 family endonuclease
MATVTKTLLTAEEFMAADLGEGLHELVRGEVVEVDRTMPEHGLVCGNACYELSSYGRRTGFGYAMTNDTAVQTERGPDTVRGADVCFYSQARWPRSKLGRSLLPIPPDLVVEVDSPSNRPGEMRAKVNEYLNAGVSLVWVIDPAKRVVAVYRPDIPYPAVLGEGDELGNLPELPGFRCRVGDFFV